MPVKRHARATPAARWHDAPVYARDDLRPGRPHRRPGDHRRDQRDHGRRARLGGARHAARPPGARARRRRCQRAHAIGTHGRPGDARGLQQPLHVDRRADGRALANTAYSVNIKERLDFSCALFDADGQPDRQRAAHAGAPGLDGRERRDRHRRARRARCKPGDVYVLNEPYNGGTHLPDVTVDRRRCSSTEPGARSDARVLRRRRAATTPTSAASRRGRCRPTRRTSRRKACCSTT